MILLVCVNHLARSPDAYPGRMPQAVVVLDGRSLCADCAAPMIKIIGERMTDEPGNDAGQG